MRLYQASVRTLQILGLFELVVVISFYVGCKYTYWREHKNYRHMARKHERNNGPQHGQTRLIETVDYDI